MTNTFTIGQKVTGGLALLAMETHKIKNTDGNFTFWYENNKLMGHALPDVGIGERERSITYFHRNTFEVVGTIEPPFKKGDLVRITSNHADALTIKDEVVEVINYDESKTFPIKVKKDDGRAAVIRENFAVKLTTDEIKDYNDNKHCKAVNALEVGSFVRIHVDSNFGSEFKAGDIVVVVFQEPHESTCPIKVAPLHNPTKSMSEWATYKEVEIVTEEEAIKAKMSLVKTGAYIKITGDKYTPPRYAPHGLKNGTVLKTTGKHRDGFAALAKKGGEGFEFSIHALDFKIMTPKEVEEYKASLIKTEKGSYLVVTCDDQNVTFKKGEVIVSTGRTNGSGVFVTSVDGTKESFKYFENVRNATLKEIEVAQRPKYNKGDYVVSIGGFNYLIGEVLEITKVNGNDHYDVVNLEGKTGGKQHYNIRKATEEEVKKAKKEVAAKKERKIFEDLGREYGELKEGDIVRVMNTRGGLLEVGDIGEVIQQNVPHDAQVKVGGRNTAANWATVKLIVPVEHRLDK